MLSAQEQQGIQPNSDRENLLHLITRVCPRDVTESGKAYSAFCELALTESSIRKLATEQGIDLETLKTWAKDFHWAERIREWKPIFQAYQRRQLQLREKLFMERWNDRRARFLEAADQLLARAELMMRHPHIQKVIHEEVLAAYPGQVIPTTTVIMPVKWQSGDIAAFQKTALALLQQAVGSREIMIDKLTSDGYVITDPTSDDTDVLTYLEAVERLEELQEEIF